MLQVRPGLRRGIWRPGSLQGSQTLKVCSGGRVQSLRNGCDCQAEPILNTFPLPKMVGIALLTKPAGRAHSNPKNAPALKPGRLVLVDLYFCFFPSRPLIAFAGFPFVAAFASPNAPCAPPPATPFMSGMKCGFDVVPSIAKGMPPLPLPSAATCVNPP